MSKLPEGKSLVLYDGSCGLCSRLVQFLIPRDPRQHLYFAPLQSEIGKAYLKQFSLTGVSEDTFVFIEQGKTAHVESGAALRVLRYLHRPWTWLSRLTFVPSPIRNACYRFVAKRRKKWFKPEACMWIPPTERIRFLNEIEK
ncbi:thiol-disulfide oxidoreductase DCC family protein [Marinicrinis sediminis]|uniref:Thiol-disulfide oxidoreductase DCC family protein n=1 Tax=Marinicrinis sediminis TaxID=1652465 RepID=A0ABW5R511_9BACL